MTAFNALFAETLRRHMDANARAKTALRRPTVTIRDMALANGVRPATAQARVRRGWDVAAACSTPPLPTNLHAGRE